MELAEKDVQTMRSAADAQAPKHTVVAKSQITQKSSGADVQPPPSGGQSPHPCYHCGGKHSHISKLHIVTSAVRLHGHVPRVCWSKGQCPALKPRTVVVGQVAPGPDEYTLLPTK